MTHTKSDVFRVDKSLSVNFTMIRNDNIRDPSVSCEAKLLHAIMLSFPDGWEYNLEHLQQFFKEGRDVVRRAMNELVQLNYVTRQRKRVENNKFAGYKTIRLESEGLGPAMTKVGRLFEEGDCFVPELLMAARANKAAFEVLRPLLSRTGVKPVARVVLGTVKGDMHDIGKNLVAALLVGGGFEVVDLGVDVPPARFVAAVAERQPELVGLSALLTTTLPGMKTTLQALQGAGLRERVKVMVGGAPVTESFAQAIGADGFADNAASAVDLARRLIGAI